MKIKIIDSHAVDSSDLTSVSGNGILEGIFKNRGVMTREEMDVYLHSDISMVHDPRLLKDAEKAAAVIKNHIEHGNKIVVYSDYDADGWGSVVCAVTLMKKLGANVTYFTNNRDMGYGANPDGVAKMLDDNPDVKLVITTDNGVVAYAAVDMLMDMGIDVVVTDHHEPAADGKIPNALAVVDPKRADDTYPFKGLCGAGVIWKVMMLVYEMLGHDVSETYEVLDIVGFATVADVVPLRDENRVIVKEGLKRINQNCRPEWDILRKVNSDYKRQVTDFTAQDIAFTFAPQVNACSRLLGSIKYPCTLFLSDNEDEKAEMASKMKGVNDERKEKTSDQTERAITLCEGMDGVPVIVIASDFFHDGLVGLVAGRIKEAFWTPTIVLAEDPIKPGILRGSGRSIAGFKMKAALDNIQSKYGLLEGYGGHDMACGLSLKKENLEEFRKVLAVEAVTTLSLDDYCRKVIVDVDIHDDESVAYVLDTLSEAEPYGQDFQVPMVRLKNFTALKACLRGTENQHIILEGKNIDITCWNGAEEWTAKGSPTTVTAVGKLERSSFNGKYSLVVDPELLISAE